MKYGYKIFLVFSMYFWSNRIKCLFSIFCKKKKRFSSLNKETWFVLDIGGWGSLSMTDAVLVSFCQPDIKLEALRMRDPQLKNCFYHLSDWPIGKSVDHFLY